MGFLNVLKNVLGNANTVAAATKVLNGKIDLASIATLLTAYLTNQGSSASAAKAEGSSLANQIASAVNLSSVANVTDLISKLKSSDKAGTDDLAQKLQSAVSVISMLAKK